MKLNFVKNSSSNQTTIFNTLQGKLEQLSQDANSKQNITRSYGDLFESHNLQHCHFKHQGGPQYCHKPRNYPKNQKTNPTTTSKNPNP